MRRGLHLTSLLLISAGLTFGYLWWTGEFRPDRPPVQNGRTSAARKPLPPRELPQISGDDLGEQLTRARRDVDTLRNRPDAPPETLGGALLRLGDLERGAGNPEEGASAFREVIALHKNSAHWHVREASRRLDDIKVLAERPVANEELWQEAFQKQWRAETLQIQGRFLEGIAVAEEALELRRRLWGSPEPPSEQTHPEVAESLLRWAWLCTEHDNFYLQSRELAAAAVSTARKAVGESHPLYGDSLFVLATLADDRGDFDEADRLYKEAIAVFKETVGEFSRPCARAISRQGRMHDTWWKLDAYALLSRADLIRKTVLAPDDPDCAESLEALAQNLYAVLEFGRAESLLQNAAVIRAASQGTEHPDSGRSNALLGVSLAMHGDSSPAMVYVADALTLSEKGRGAKHPKASQLRLLSAIVRQWGLSDYFGVFRESEQLLESMRQMGLEKHPDFALALSAQALCVAGPVEINRDTGAPGDDAVWQFQFACLAKWQQAVDAYRALPHFQQIGDYIYALLNLANAHYLTNYERIDRNAAWQLLTEAESVVKKYGESTHPWYFAVPQAQSQFWRSQGNYELAAPLAEEQLKRFTAKWGNGSPWLHFSVLGNVIGELFHQGENATRLRELSQAQHDEYYGIYRTDAPRQSEAARLTMLNECGRALDNLLAVATLQHDLPAVYNQVLAVKGSASYLQLADRSANERGEFDDVRRQVESTRRNLKTAAFSGNAADAGWSTRVTAASDARDLAEHRLALKTRSNLLPDVPVTWQELQKVLPRGTAFVDFVQYQHQSPPPDHRGYLRREPHMLAFILRDSGPPACVELGRSRPIRDAVLAWREAIRRFQRSRADCIDEPARKLAELIWRPLQEHLDGIDSLAISPSGPLSFVSFAALPGRASGSYALEDFDIHYTNSGRWLYQQLQQDAGDLAEGLLTCGDIRYTDKLKRDRGKSQDLLPDADTVPNLLASGLEIDDIGRLFSERGTRDKSLTLRQSQATAQEFAAELARNWRYVHFAGHGQFISPSQAAELIGRIPDEVVTGTRGPSGRRESGLIDPFIPRNQSLLSGLLLAPDPGAKKPGFLTADELGNFDLRKTDLVVLSACETGLGCSAGGDGVLGLTRAFLTAGVRSVVTSLWKVDDAATSELMRQFYHNLWIERLPKAQALRKAQLSLIRDSESVDHLQETLIAQLKSSHADRSADELREELNRGGLLAGEVVDVEPDPADEHLSVISNAPSTSSHMHPALWAAFILNGNPR